MILHQWFLDFCQQRPDAVGGDQLLQKAFEAAFHIIRCLQGRCLDCMEGSSRKNEKTARNAHELGRTLYRFMPNLHRLDHVFRAMIFLGNRAPYILNHPIRGSSRRVGTRCAILHALQRCLMASYAKYCAYGLTIKSCA